MLRPNTLKRGILLIKKNFLASKAKKVISTTIIILSFKNKLYSSFINKVITKALLLNIFILCYILQDMLSQGKVFNLIMLLIQRLKSAYNISPSSFKEEDTSNYNFLLLFSSNSNKLAFNKEAFITYSTAYFIMPQRANYLVIRTSSINKPLSPCSANIQLLEQALAIIRGKVLNITILLMPMLSPAKNIKALITTSQFYSSTNISTPALNL